MNATFARKHVLNALNELNIALKPWLARSLHAPASDPRRAQLSSIYWHLAAQDKTFGVYLSDPRRWDEPVDFGSARRAAQIVLGQRAGDGFTPMPATAMVQAQVLLMTLDNYRDAVTA